MSARNPAGPFVQATEITPPHEFIEFARVDAACILLEGSDCPLQEVGYDFGFGTGNVFSNRLGVPPTQYAASFRHSKTITEPTGIA
jgi:transcriptional regulator GlxA family with amidase domain